MLSARSYVYADKFTACVQNVRLPNARMPVVNVCVDDVLFNAGPKVQQTPS